MLGSWDINTNRTWIYPQGAVKEDGRQMWKQMGCCCVRLYLQSVQGVFVSSVGKGVGLRSLFYSFFKTFIQFVEPRKSLPKENGI